MHASTRRVMLAFIAYLCVGSSSGLAQRKAPPMQAQASGGQIPSAEFHVVRSISGSKGSMEGSQFVIQDPRTVFRVPEDRQVIVYFDWEGPPGPHHFQGSWRSPDGKVILISDFAYVAPGTRFSGYWTMALPEMIAPGLWALEAQIDSRPAGVHTFEIVLGAGASPPPPPMPQPSEVYERAVAASVFVDKLDAKGELISEGSGFFLAPGVLATAFQAIDGASSLRVNFPDGTRAETQKVLAWNRRQDWALVQVEGAKAKPLDRALANSWKVGDNCYVLGSPAPGSRTIGSANITGTQDSPEAGARLNLSWFDGERMAGSPLLDSYGRVVGIVGGSLVPGVDSVRRTAGTYFSVATPVLGISNQQLAVPINLVPESSAAQQPVMLSDLAARGLFVIPLPRKSQAYMGSLCKRYKRVGKAAILPEDTTTEFSHADGSIGLVVMWTPTEKIKTTQMMRVYDLNNQAVGESSREKIELKPQVTAYSAWKMAIETLRPGIYRVDVFLGDEPHWRSFFRVVE